jgi:hypothetical protein
MRRPYAGVAVLSAAAAVFSLAGCGSSTSPAQTSFTSLNTGEQASFEADAVMEVEANIFSFTSSDPYRGFGFARVARRRASGLTQILAGKVTQRPRFQTVGCQPTISGDTTDADGDGIPDNATSTFGCDTTFTGGSQSQSGTMSFADPTPMTADAEYNSSFNLTVAANSSSIGDASFSLKGQNAVTQSPGTLSEAGNSAYDIKITNAPNEQDASLTLATNNNATYTYTGSDPTAFGVLRDGSFNLTGNWSYDVSSSPLTTNLSFSVSTPGGLSIKSSCPNNDGHIDSGEIDITFSDGTLVKAQYSGCPAAPSYTIS